MIRSAILGGTLLVLTLLGLSLHTPGAGTVGTPEAKVVLVVILCVSAAVYLVAVAAMLRRPAPGRVLWIVLLVAVAMRVPLIVAPPFLSSDVYRYVWDGRVQAAGINPYRYIPDDPALTALRDTTIFPHINRADYAPTIYPPMAQVVFAIVGRVWSSVTGLKVMMFGFEALAVFCLLGLLDSAGLPRERVLIYAWNPLPVWAFAGNGHVDAAVAGLVALTLLLRVRRHDGWAGLALGLAVLTKFLPAVIAPVLWRRGAGWRLAATAVVTVVVLYGLYSSVGWRVFGFLGGYGAEEGLDNGSGVWLLAGLSRLAPLPALAARCYFVGLAILLAGLGAWYAFVRRPDDAVAICGAAGVMMAVLTFGISPHYPWYFAWLAVPCVLAPNPAVLWLATAPVLIYLDTYGDRFVWPSVMFAPAVLLALVGVLRPAAAPIKGTNLMSALQDPRRYFEAIGAERNDIAGQPPVCLYLEVTNRCNLLCETCPRTFEDLEPPADMTWDLFTRIVDQVPNVARVVLHGVGEPMLVKALPRMIRYLKDRGTYVLFNTNGTLLNQKKFQEIIDTGLDELRVSLDAADRETYMAIRGKDFFPRIIRDVGKFTAYQRKMGVEKPRVSLWLTGLKETVDQLPAFVRLSADMGVKEVHLQRLVFDTAGFGKARAEFSLFEQTRDDEQAAIETAQAIGAELGVTLDASGATEPGLSLKRAADDKPWATCRRPWSLMYFTAHGRALPCCIAPFSARGYENYTLGDATQESLREIWNSPAYRDFRGSLLGDTPPAPCQNCGLRWSL